ncbi:hypothetical protein [Dactylosporangium sp. NPDC048998]|uniref:hypothetical protein n=1 Tax=Dactylosporangium sp. NPDC048998 TaxID=3363976 RepID=UPI00371D3212
MAQVVDSDAGQAGIGGEGVQPVQHVLGAQRPAVRAAEHESVVTGRPRFSHPVPSRNAGTGRPKWRGHVRGG